MKSKSDLDRQPLEFSPTGPFDQDLQTRGPQPRLPGLDTGNPWRQLVLQQFPGAPPRGQALPIQPTPTIAQGSTQASIQQQGIEQFAMQPDVCQRAPITGPQQIGIQQAFPALNGYLDLPAHPIQGQGRWP